MSNEQPHPFRPPVTMVVNSSTPLFLGRYNQAFTVINLGTNPNTTVWLADNAGMQIGQGTPLYPGTSFLWNAGGDLYAIAETDGVSVILSFDVTDWEPNPIAIAAAILNAGILLVDQPTLLFNGNLDNAATDIFDIRTYQSLFVSISPVEVITYPTCPRYENIFFGTTDGLFQLITRTIKVSGDGSGWSGALPCIGAGYRLSAVGTTSGADVQIWGSHRPLHLMQDHHFAANGNFLFNEAILVTAGSNTITAMPSYIGMVEIHCTVSAGNHANSGIQIETVDGSTNRAYHRAGFAVPYGTPSIAIDVGSKPIQIALAGQAWRLRIDNGDVADRTFATWVAPITSPGGMY